MVSRYLEQQSAVQATLLTKDLRSTTDLPSTLSDADMTAAEDFVQILQPMKTATVVMCEDKEPTLSIVAPLYSRLLMNTSEDANLATDSKAVREMRKAIHADLSSRYRDQVMMHKSSALDPRFKHLPFLGDVEKMNIFSNLAIEAAELDVLHIKQEPADDTRLPALPSLPDVPEPITGTTSDDDLDPPEKKPKLDEPEKTVKCALDDLFGEDFITKTEEGRKSKSDMATEEVNSYRNMDSILLSANPLEWWKDHAFLFPLLSVLAKKYLCIPSTSVPSERVFSTAGDIVTANRASLKAHHVDMLFFLKTNLKLKR